MQGLGLMLTEDVKVDTETGKLLADSTWTYKVPSAETVPREINVYLLKNHPHPRGIMSSKATGEPPLLLSISALCAVQVRFPLPPSPALVAALLPHLGSVAPPCFANPCGILPGRLASVLSLDGFGLACLLDSGLLACRIVTLCEMVHSLASLV